MNVFMEDTCGTRRQGGATVDDSSPGPQPAGWDIHVRPQEDHGVGLHHLGNRGGRGEMRGRERDESTIKEKAW